MLAGLLRVVRALLVYTVEARTPLSLAALAQVFVRTYA